MDDEEAAWSSPLPDQERGHLPRRLSISTTPLTMVGSPLASSDDLRRLASSSLISEVGVEQHFAFLAEAVGREGCRPTSRTTVMLKDVNYKVRARSDIGQWACLVNRNQALNPDGLSYQHTPPTDLRRRQNHRLPHRV